MYCIVYINGHETLIDNEFIILQYVTRKRIWSGKGVEDQIQTQKVQFNHHYTKTIEVAIGQSSIPCKKPKNFIN